jgi:pyruvate formate lyase activating enzyme
LDVVKRNIQISAENCHTEITTLVIPGENDTKEEIAALARWLSELNPGIPLHLSRFFPCYQYKGKKATEVSHIHELVDIAQKYLKYVYPGNC